MKSRRMPPLPEMSLTFPEPSLSPETCERCVTVADGTRYLCSRHRPPPAPVMGRGRVTVDVSDAYASTDPGR